jgi:amino acid transporter
VGFLVAGLGIFVTNLTALLRSMPLQFLMFVGLSMASGGLAVWLYKRRTGQALSVRGGARLGWITGVLSFLIVIVILAITLATVGFEHLETAFRDPAVTGNIPPADLDRLLENPAAIATALAFTLAVIFGAYTVAASVGGAVGAKLMHKNGDSA